MNRTLIGVAIASALLLTTGCSKKQNAQVSAPQVTVAVAETGYSAASALEQEARAQLKTLLSMMEQARAKNIDVTREETLVWFSQEFLKFANWDEANPKAIEQAFGYERYYADDKVELAAALPDFERQKVIDILTKGIDVLGQELRGEIKRRPVNKVDWQGTKASDNMFISNGKPIFLYDYFSKSVGQPLTNTDVYNDHLGALYHGGENLYPTDHDRAINSFLLKEDGTFDQELMKELTDIPDTNIGFLYYWIMGIPEWVEKQEPEVRKGRSLFTGFDIDNPLVRDVWGKIIHETGRLTKGKKVTELGFVLANEPHWYAEKGHWTANFEEMTSISSYTLNKFRDWLDNKYASDIAALNSNWGTSFTSFETVAIEIPIDPALQGQPIWYDWSRYNMDRSTDWFTFVQNELHSVNPDAHTSIKVMPRMFMYDSRSGGIDTEALAELTTMVGHDAKAFGSENIRPGKSSEWIEKYAYSWGMVAMFHDFMESVAPDKINFNSESHFLSSGQWRDLDTRTSYVRSVYWLATLLGMDANTGWFWARDPDGSPEDRLEGDLDFFDPGLGGAYAGSNNMQPHVTNEVTQVMFDLNSFSEEIIALREQMRPIRLFYSETTAINTDDYMTKGSKLYEELFFEGLPLGFVTKNIIEKQDNSDWETVVVYNNPNVTDAEFDALQSYLGAGGTVIVDSKSLLLNEYGQKRTKKLKAGKGKLITLEPSADLAKIKQVALAQVTEQMPDVVIAEDNGEAYKTTTWRTIKQSDGTYLVNILNVGHNTAKLDLTLRNGKPVTVTDLMTGNSLDSTFELASEGVLLLEVKSH
ncbi:beta-galactosidase [Colwellia sp. 1_MG-2023]|uniref:beta-galactosidase n=1 Tax=unclassified Colwellia TaxID=196834 RepID=UPI001C093FFA|nr:MULTISPECIES: alpha-amylase family protein [unclassified Colwellia]MBU2924267.1 beta-galactosidase [Colwellia sp. C2M11]MDO6652976.1 beta-galactosidase [Colwellia sp. 3_MG-2023]MDO6665458.1 beta-galactosidase [Colwellia sp. 2_MG-2023]MDO6689783.1 beta-galactosidase [Colwellia sp. 1_MG-2023]